MTACWLAVETAEGLTPSEAGGAVRDILGSGAEAFLRWLHVIAGIAWIGSSFYFIHLDYSLKSARGCRPRPTARPGRCTAAASTTW